MNWKTVFKIQGILLIVLSASMIPPLIFSLYYNSGDVREFLYSILITLFSGSLLFLMFRSDTDLRPREGFVIVSLAWISAALFGALPFYFYGMSGGSYVDCVFETMSGFTTTGSTILIDIESLPRGLLFWRSETHWLGGMGIIMLTIAILPVLGLSSNTLYKAEVPGPMKDKISPRITDTAKMLWYIYFGMTVIQSILLLFGGMSLYDSLCHTFGTLATGGFSTLNRSVAGFNNVYIEIIIMIFMYLAGINFILHFFLLKGKFRDFFSNSEWRFYTAILLGSVIIVASDLYFRNDYSSFLSCLRYSSFQVISITTTTGFVSADFEKWSHFSKTILIVLMFFGGCSGSTGGSIKQIRVMSFFKFSFIEIKKMIYPRSVISLKIGNDLISDSIFKSISAFFILFIAVFAFSTLFLTFRGYDIITSFSASIATLGNIGPGLSRVGAIENYAFFDSASKIVLSLNMLLGRLELYSVLILFYSIFNPKKFR